MQKMIYNLINGNLEDAKEAAKLHSWEAIFKALRDDFCFSEAKARTAADYLKGSGSFQDYCDAS